MKKNDEVLGFIYIVVALFAAFYFATHVGQPIDPNLSEQEYKQEVRLLMLSPIAFAAFSIIGVCNIKFRKIK
jgi:hypothetical protein